MSHRGQTIALMIAGWAPLGLLHGIADGHNDSLLVLAMLLGLVWFEGGNAIRSAIAIGASVAIKYVTGPLVVLFAVRALVSARDERRIWLVALVIAGIVATAFLMMFYRSPDFFAPLVEMQGWRFFTPSAIVLDFIEPRGVPRSFARLIDSVVVAGSAAGAIASVRRGTPGGFLTAALWIMFGLLVGVTGHVWPWFVLWLLGLAAAQPSSLLARFSVGMAAAAPFILIPWRMNPALEPLYRFTIPGLALYASGLAALLVSVALTSEKS
jgi:alpha-1,6-mannosyltransferase